MSGLTVALDLPHDLPGTVHVAERCRKGAVHLTLREPTPQAVAVNRDGAFVFKDLLPSQYSLSAFILDEPVCNPGFVAAQRQGIAARLHYGGRKRPGISASPCARCRKCAAC